MHPGAVDSVRGSGGPGSGRDAPRLDYPWNIARTGDRFLLTEKADNIVVIEDGRLRRYTLQPSDSIGNEGGGGLLGMALSRDFPQSGIAYFYHSYRSDAGLTNKVIQARFDGNV